MRGSAHLRVVVLNREVIEVIPAPDEKVPALCVGGQEGKR
jgi:hypothetical protein